MLIKAKRKTENNENIRLIESYGGYFYIMDNWNRDILKSLGQISKEAALKEFNEYK